MSRLDEIINAKKQKRADLEAQGIVVHPYSFVKTHSIQAARVAMGDDVTTAGRIMSMRTHGKVTFATLQDHSGSMQVMIKADTIGEIWYKRLSLIDASDYLGVQGKVIETKTGEVTVEVNELTILSKALRTVPNTWQGIEDKETRFRKRYLDLLINPETKRVLDARWTIEKEIRRYLQDIHQFTEVETPVLQPLYGGTNAKPFMTHMNALDSDFYLRIAPELYLKRLIVGGYERIFEIARNFRNEGIDLTHQPEFTMIEWYHAYADYQTMMDVAEGLLKHLSQKVNGTLTVSVNNVTVELDGAWPRLRMVDAIKKYLDLDAESMDDDDLTKTLQEKNVELTGSFTRGKAIFALFDKLVTASLMNPTWIIDYPQDVSPLAKAHRSDKGWVERFELYVAGKEMADGWSEITDALDQRARFENEQKNMREGDEEAQPLDEEFLEAMEYGMPPLGGIGMGIDRLVMFLTNTWSIRETIAFPTLRPTPEQLAMSTKMMPKVQHSPIATFSAKTYAIEPAVQADFPGIFFAYTKIQGVTIKKKDESLEDAKNTLYESKKTITTEEIGNIPAIQAYRSLLKATGTDWHSKRPSPEALLRRISLQKGLYTINTAVDAYNLAVIESGVGLGGFDVSKLSEPVALRYSLAGEKMRLLGDDHDTKLRDKQLIYADTQKAITLDLNYRDIDATKISIETNDIILFADGAPGLSKDDVVAVLQKGADYIATYCGGTVAPIQIIE